MQCMLSEGLLCFMLVHRVLELTTFDSLEVKVISHSWLPASKSWFCYLLAV